MSTLLAVLLGAVAGIAGVMVAGAVIGLFVPWPWNAAAVSVAVLVWTLSPRRGSGGSP